MIRRWALWLIIANLCGLIALTFALPQLMVAPGPLIPAHKAITSDCFACHAPWTGVAANRCATCHKLADIGVRTTTGMPVKRKGNAIAFHQSLTQPNCIACHSDHSGPQLVKASQQRFAHALLKPELRGQCATCHRAPQTPLHAQSGKNCAACHSQTAWKPATFDHRRFFALTGPHKASCSTCHTGGDTSRYTCFSCHEHQPAQIRAEHAEEGIRNIENCVRCHRSGDGEAGEREGGEGGDDD
ncbi:cytochrome c3 family protein [Sphingomonas sp.]|uniref:cytochrome c3 family protein n=1 Tax=Sphingomonas sp. TaxID=28214 RepID=UPI0035A8C16A